MVKLVNLRKWSGVWFAAFLALAVLMPAVDTFVCIDDGGAKTVLAMEQSALPAANENPVQQHDDGDSSCIHGHCHHWVGYNRLNERLSFAATSGRAGRIVAGYGRHTSAPQIALLRPPQA